MFMYSFPQAGEQNILLMILTGLGIGFLAGLFGVGGGFLAVPILNLIYGINILIAKGTDLFTILFTTTSAGYRHHKNRFVNFKVGITIGLASIVTAWIGSKLSFGINKELFKLVFGVLLLIIALRMIGVFDRFFEKEEEELKEKGVVHTGRFGFITQFEGEDIFISIPRVILIGVILGLFSGFFGVGGGVILVPMLHYILKMPMHMVVGTSVIIIWWTALSGTTAHWVEGKVDWQLGLILAIGSVVGAYLGALLAKRLNQKRLKRYFSIVLIVAGAKMLWVGLSKLI